MSDVPQQRFSLLYIPRPLRHYDLASRAPIHGTVVHVSP